MKKVFNLKSGVKYLLFLVFTYMACACSNNEEPDEAPTKKEITDIELIQKLQSYNDSVIYMHGVTRGSIRKGGIFLADVGGAAVGLHRGVTTGRWILAGTGGAGLHLVAFGVLGWTAFQSACASYSMYRMTENEVNCDFLEELKNNPMQKISFGRFYNKVSNKVRFDKELYINNDSVYMQMGKLHNNILTELNGSINLPILTSSIFMKGSSPSLDDYEIPNNNYYEEEYEMNSYGISLFSDNLIESNSHDALTGIESFCENDDYVSYLNTLQSNNYITQNVNNIIRLMYEVIMQSVNTSQDLNQRIAAYKAYIENSNGLSKIERQQLYLALEVARNSYIYWHNKGLI